MQRRPPPAPTTTTPCPAPEGFLARRALRFAAVSERWFPDAYVFAALAVLIVAVAAVARGAPLGQVAQAFGDGYWSLITFTLQQAMVAVSGYVIATAPPMARAIDRVARWPASGRAAVTFVALVAMLLSLLSWAMSLIFSGLLVRAIARRQDIRLDYRAAGAAGYLGLGCTWALGLSSSAAQLQANAASIPPALLRITGVLPFSQTIFLWQSLVLAAAVVVVSLLVCWYSAPSAATARTAADLGVDLGPTRVPLPPRQRPGEWLEYSPLLTLVVAGLGGIWIWRQFAQADALLAISSLNTYNFVLLMAGMLLHWRPRSFLGAAYGAVPATAGILIQFPLYGGIAAIITGAAAAGGQSLAQWLSQALVSLSSRDSFPVLMGLYSAVLGLFAPSGGGKWLLEAPYVMGAANQLGVHLGWTVQIYNAAEALPNLVNPFYMLPLLGILGIKARDIVGFSALQCVFHLPLVLFLTWLLSRTLPWVPAVFS